MEVQVANSSGFSSPSSPSASSSEEAEIFCRYENLSPFRVHFLEFSSEFRSSLGGSGEKFNGLTASTSPPPSPPPLNERNPRNSIK